MQALVTPRMPYSEDALEFVTMEKLADMIKREVRAIVEKHC